MSHEEEIVEGNGLDTQEEISETETETEPESEAPEPESEEEEEDVISIGDRVEQDESELDDVKNPPPWLDGVRNANKHLNQENARLKDELKKLSKAPQAEAIVKDPGPMPDIEKDCEWDKELFRKKIDEWNRKRDEFREYQIKEQQKEQQHLDEYKSNLTRYKDQKSSIRVKDFSDAELAVTNALSIEQQNMLLAALDRPAIAVYALGKDPGKLNELAKMGTSLQFAVALGKLEKEIKVSKRKPTTKPERPIKGSGSLSGVVDGELNRLEKEAEKTNNLTALVRHRMEKKRRQAAG